MDAIPQRVYDVWWSYYQCEPFGSQWEQVATVASMLSFNNTLTAAANGSKLPAASVLHFMPADSMPWRKRKQLTAKTDGLTNGRAQAAHICRAFGFNP